MNGVAEEVKKEDFPKVSPWDVLIWRLDSLEKYIQRETGDIRREIGDVRRELAELRQELREEVRGTRRSFQILEWTAVLGFLAVIATVLAAKLL